MERTLEKYSVRRNPLGMDRHHRCYWWGLGGERNLIYVQDNDRVAPLTRPAQLDALYEVLDRRGIREAGLAQGIERVRRHVSSLIVVEYVGKIEVHTQPASA